MIGHQGHRRAVRTLLFGLLLAAASMAPQKPIEATPSPENPAALILAGWFGAPTPTPSYVASNFAFLDSQPFDGMVIYMWNSSFTLNLTSGIMKGTPYSYDTMMSVLSPVAGLNFQKLKNNLVLVHGSTPPDFFDDWSGVVQNYANLAKAAKNSGLKGICFDNEQYSAPWADYGAHLKYYSTKTFSEYQTQARLRGKQIMEAMVVEFPDVVFLTLHGPYISEPDAPTNLQFPQWQSANELQGPFFAGGMEGAGSTAFAMDGGELYSLRTPSEFQDSYYWRRHVLPSSQVDSSFIPAALRTVWPDRSSISFGVYDVAFWGQAMNPTVLRSTLANAMRQADKYVWFYSEAYTYLKSPANGGAPQSWIDAIVAARNDVAVAPPAPAPAPAGPAAPTNLAATAVSPFDIDLSWADNSPDETGFEIERRTVINGTWAPVTTAAAGATYYRNGGLWSATAYEYRVRAVHATGASDFTATVTATTPTVGSFIPAAPSNLAAVAASTSEVDLSWLDNSSTESGFQVERRTEVDGTWALVTTCAEGATTHRDTGLAEGTGYVYRIRASNNVGTSAYTAEAAVTTASSVPAAPGAPTNLSATAPSPFAIDLSWADNSSNETGFEIERRTAINGTWALVTTTPADATSWHNGSLMSATGYVYRVRAVNAGGPSVFSNEATMTTPSVSSSTPASPSGLSAVALSSTTVQLTWTDNATNESGYKIERRRSGGSWVQVAVVGSGVTSYQDAGRTRGITYVYRIRAYNTVGHSGYSGQARVTMP